MRHGACWRSRHSPGNEQRDFWSSKAADTPGSRNLIGHQGSGRRRAGRARHLRHRPRRPAGRHPCARPRAAVELLRRAAMAPAVIWVAYWNKFGIPEKQPSYIGVDIEFLVDRPGQGGRAASQIQEPELSSPRDITRRDLLALGAAAAASPLLPGPAFAAVPAEPGAAWAFGLRRPEIPGPTSRISTTSIPTRRRAGCSISSRPTGSSTRTR